MAASSVSLPACVWCDATLHGGVRSAVDALAPAHKHSARDPHDVRVAREEVLFLLGQEYFEGRMRCGVISAILAEEETKRALRAKLLVDPDGRSLPRLLDAGWLHTLEAERDDLEAFMGWSVDDAVAHVRDHVGCFQCDQSLGG